MAVHLESAVRIFEQIGRTTSSGAVWSRRLRCDSERTTARARQPLQRALALFEECGTVDEPARVRALLE